MLDRCLRFALCGTLVVGLFLLSPGAWAIPPKPLPDSLSNQARSQAEKLVRLALKAEADGKFASRNQLLAKALQSDPDFPPAQWQSGNVLFNEQWVSVFEAQRQAAADPQREEYERRSEQLDGSLEAELNLARWCTTRGLHHQQRYHWYRVLLIDPTHREAQRAMGVRLDAGRLLTIEEIDLQKQQRKDSRRLEEKMKPQIMRWLRDWKRADSAAKQAIIASISQLDQPQVISLVERELSGRHAKISLAIVSALGRMADDRATRSLMRHAVLSSFDEVRTAATEQLAERPFYEFIPTLMGQLKLPIETEFGISPQRDGSVLYTHELYERGPERNKLQIMQGNFWQLGKNPEVILVSRRNPSSHDGRPKSVTKIPLSMKVKRRIAQEKQSRAMARSRSYLAQALNLEQRLAEVNQTREERNQRIVTVLAGVTGQYLEDDPQAWWDWWRDYNELAPYEIPTYEQTYTRADYDRCTVPDYYIAPSCFPHGTPVWTMTGQRGIETVGEGDWVLAQDPETGHLAFKPVLGTTFREPSPLIEVAFGSRTLRATLGHPFWVDGKGWRMAKQLKAGDILHSLYGPLLIESVAKVEEEEAYNLVVGDFETFFVGKNGVLVHDNSIRKPTQAIVPGLADSL